MYCVSDPNGKRVGSGGGTLNALHYVQLQLGHGALQTERILMIHSGGDSQRAPTCSVHGKAWLSLNSLLNKEVVASPLGLLITELSRFCAALTPGALVVASSDVLLDFGGNSDPAVFNPDGVTLVTVPELPCVAENHGVVVPVPLESSQGTVITAIKDYLQKPSATEMKTRGAIFPLSLQCSASYVWIDTGVVGFCGRALKALLSLLSIPEFEPLLGRTDMSLRIELYSEILLACSVNHKRRDILSYLHALKMPADKSPTEFSNHEKAVRILLEKFAMIPLFSACVISGLFAHLGTTGELKALLNSCYNVTEAETGSSVVDIKQSLNRKKLAEKYHLVPNVLSVSNHGVVTIGSYLGSDGHIITNSIVEYSVLSGDYSVGEASFISYVNEDFGRGLKLGKAMLLQQVALERGDMLYPVEITEQGHFAFVAILLAVEDDVKADFKLPTATICGNSWSCFFSVKQYAVICYCSFHLTICLVCVQCGDITPDDIWSPGSDCCDRTLWSAKLFPVFASLSPATGSEEHCLIECDSLRLVRLPLSRIQNVLTWFQRDLSFASVDVVMLWKASRRLSLSDILKMGDAFAMRKIRLTLSTVLSSPVFDRIGHSTEISVAFTRSIAALSTFVKQVRLLLGYQNFSNASILEYHILIILWCWRLVLPTDCPNSVMSFYITTSAKMLEIFLVEAPNAQPSCLALSNKCFLLVYTFMDMWNRVSACFSHDILYSSIKIVGTLPASLLQIIARGYERLVDRIDAVNHSRLLFIFAWILRHSDFRDIQMDLDMKRRFTYENLEDLRVAGCIIVKSVLQYFTTSKCVQRTVFKKWGDVSVDIVAQELVSMQVNYSLNVHGRNISKAFSATDSSDTIFSDVATVVATAPARIDIMGGWSDTPPTCFQCGGAVFNVAVSVDGVKPLLCAARFIKSNCLILRSLTAIADMVDNGEEEILDLEDCSVTVLEAGPHSKCALLKACVILLDLKKMVREHTKTLGPKFNGLEIASCSLLPAGSGMGGSSILAAVIIQSIYARLGKMIQLDYLSYLVSQTEQILTTGGGWQDQIGAIYGGFKLAMCKAGLPMIVAVNRLLGGSKTPLNSEVVEGRRILANLFSNRVRLIYTGQQRLAKDTLIHALRYSSMTPMLNQTGSVSDNLSDYIYLSGSDVLGGTISLLIKEAISAADLICGFEQVCMAKSERDVVLQAANAVIDELAICFVKYWTLKREMARESEPHHLKELRLSLAPVCLGWSLCGAGGGGFAVAILKQDVSLVEFRSEVERVNSLWMLQGNIDRQCTVHSAAVDFDGISVSGYDSTAAQEETMRDILNQASR